MSFLVATSSLVQPAPYGDDAYLWFFALSMGCELLLWAGIVLLTGRVLCASGLLGLLVAAVILTSNLKYEYTGVVALPVDVFAAIGVIYDLGTFVGYLEYHLPEVAGLVALAGLLGAGLMWEPPVLGWSRRSALTRAAGLAFIFWFFYPVTSANAPVQRLYRAAGATFDGLHPNDSVAAMGLFSHLLVAAPEFFPRLPTEHGEAALFHDYFQGLKAPEPVAGPQPDIVVVLGESLFDPRRLNIPIDPAPLTTLDAFSSDADYHGTFKVHTVGGGTVLTEYSVLTGIPTNILGQSGSWPFYSLVTGSTWSLARQLGSLGYRTVAIYPVSGSLFNARIAYEFLGFDEFLDRSDFDLDQDIGRYYITNDAIARKVLEVIEESDVPVFVWALTMETHGPWSFWDSREPQRYRVGGDIDSQQRDMLTDYIHRLPKLEALATTLVQHLDDSDRPFVFSLFGDHLPAMFDLFDNVGFKEDAGVWGDPLTETPYFIRGNVKNTEPNEAHVDVSFLGSLVLEAAGLDGGDFFEMSGAYRQLCRGTFERCNAGDEYRDAYIQILYDFLRDQLATDRARGAVAAREYAPPYRLDDLIESGSEFFGGGWSTPESWGMWTVAASAIVSLRVEDPGTEDLLFAARIRNGATVTGAELRVNGQPLDSWDFDGQVSPHIRTVVIPAEIVPLDGTLRIEIATRDFESVGPSGETDSRRLGVAVFGIRVCQGDDKPCDVPAG
ncbi:MAG: LTA synthase family protein [Ilumatobacter sp.]|nr:LTA synthase family protein [Ilumatobacter sp.]